jgi:hypothetical protein
MLGKGPPPLFINHVVPALLGFVPQDHHLFCATCGKDGLRLKFLAIPSNTLGPDHVILVPCAWKHLRIKPSFSYSLSPQGHRGQAQDLRPHGDLTKPSLSFLV